MPFTHHSSLRFSATATFLILGVSIITAAPAALTQTAPAVKSVGDVKKLLLPALPPDAKEIPAAMTTASVGQTITLRGNVALSKDAFGDKDATFLLVDESTRKGDRPLPDKLPDTPPTGDIPAESRATIQVVDAAGRPLNFGLNGEHGLKPGAEVFVTGTVAAANGKDLLVITATGLHIPKAPLPIGFFTDKPADNARDISEARRAGTLKAGDEVVLRGRVGGSKQPFVAGRAIFTLVGRGLKACNENADDKCSMPWDYCCDTREDILANSITVQIVDAKSQVLRTDMKGRRGLKELSDVVVVGKVVSADRKAVVVNVTSMSFAR